MGFRFQDLMVDVLTAGNDPNQERSPRDNLECPAPSGCPYDTLKDRKCPHDTKKPECQALSFCPFDTIPDSDREKPKRPPADLALLRRQLHVVLAGL
jgi:hypothetical protein